MIRSLIPTMIRISQQHRLRRPLWHLRCRMRYRTMKQRRRPLPLRVRNLHLRLLPDRRSQLLLICRLLDVCGVVEGEVALRAADVLADLGAESLRCGEALLVAKAV